MAEKSVAMKVVEKVEKQAAIKKVVNKKYQKSQHHDQRVPGVDAIFDAGEKFFQGIGRFFVALWEVVYIIPVIIMAALHGASSGLLKGLQKATSSYSKFLEGEKE